MPEYTAEVDAVGTLRLLDSIHACGLTNKVKFYQASTSELYGKVQEVPQKETTPFYPRSPYGMFYLTYLIIIGRKFIISCRSRTILNQFFDNFFFFNDNIHRYRS